MGCDIHMYVERKDYKGNWRTADLFCLNECYSQDDEDELEYSVQHIYRERDYALFALLADVRNYNNIKPIDYPRGVPDDSCKTIQDEYQRDRGDAHSASWFTLQELIDYDNKQPSIKRGGKISPQCADNLEQGITPKCWCVDTSDKTWVYREWYDNYSPLSEIVKRLKYRASEFYFIYDFLWDSDRVNSRQEAYEKSKDIRIVFWFDN